ncbi:MAG TPA: inositol monophosphatase family protein, partial [Tepidiformaceae bacterium]|nr:inositol monophosphatase family protein [Tepidiformaceae bacterium]
MSGASNQDLLSLATGVAAEAAQLIARYGREGFEIGTKSSRTDMVTEADRAAEALIVPRILEARPHDGLLGEEGASREGTSGVRWFIDPLDCTTNFIYGIPAYAVSIAVERDGVVVAAVVHDVAHTIAYTASLGGGAFRNGQPVAITGNLDLSTCLFGTGFAYDPIRRAEQAAFQALTLPHIRDVRRMGSAALPAACSMATSSTASTGGTLPPGVSSSAKPAAPQAALADTGSKTATSSPAPPASWSRPPHSSIAPSPPPAAVKPARGASIKGSIASGNVVYYAPIQTWRYAVMVLAEEKVISPFLEGNFAPVREEVTSGELRVIGEIPAGLEGMFVRTGSNPQFDVIKNYHWFGGDGMLHGVRVKDGKVTYRNRYVQTEAYHREKAAGKALWDSGLGRPDFESPNGPSRGNTGN